MQTLIVTFLKYPIILILICAAIRFIFYKFDRLYLVTIIIAVFTILLDVLFAGARTGGNEGPGIIVWLVNSCTAGFVVAELLLCVPRLVKFIRKKSAK